MTTTKCSSCSKSQRIKTPLWKKQRANGNCVSHPCCTGETFQIQFRQDDLPTLKSFLRVLCQNRLLFSPSNHWFRPFDVYDKQFHFSNGRLRFIPIVFTASGPHHYVNEGTFGII